MGYLNVCLDQWDGDLKPLQKYEGLLNAIAYVCLIN